MNEKEPIKIKLSTAILLFIIFILILVIIFMYLYFSNSKNGNNNTIENNTKSILENEYSNSSTISNSTQNNQTSTIKQLDINSNEVIQLYKYIMKVNSSQEELVYRNTKVTEKDLNNQLKLATIFQNITKNDASNIKYITDNYGFTTEHIYYNKSTIENINKKIFGDSSSIIHESCENLLAQAKEYKNGEYDCYDIQGGGDFPWSWSCFEIISAEQSENEIYIYDNYVHIYENNISGISFTIYSSSDKNSIIATNVKFDDFLKNAELSSGDYSFKTIINNLKQITNNKIKTFKHTFKKNTNGTYYWYSTEPIN